MLDATCPDHGKYLIKTEAHNTACATKEMFPSLLCEMDLNPCFTLKQITNNVLYIIHIMYRTLFEFSYCRMENES